VDVQKEYSEVPENCKVDNVIDGMFYVIGNVTRSCR